MYNREYRGFTLIELIVVLAVIGVVIFVALPKATDISQGAKIAATKSGLSEIRDAINLKYLQNRAAGSTIPWPFTLSASDFKSGSFPVNKLNNSTAINSTLSTPTGTTPTAYYMVPGGHGGTAYYGWWIIGTQWQGGKCGAYSDGTVQTSDW